MVDIFQPCVTYSKVNTYKWFKENTYSLEEDYDPTDRVMAFKKAVETEPLPIGIFYVREGKPTFEENTRIYENDQRPLYQRDLDYAELEKDIEALK